MLWELMGGAAVAAIVSIIACRGLIAGGPIDKPTSARHAHDLPTPTSGGVGIAIGFAVGLMVMALFGGVLHDSIAPRGATMLSQAAGFAYGFSILGFWDDANPLGARLKFALFGLLSVAAVFTLGAVDTFQIGNVLWVAAPWLAIVGTALWIFTLVNCVNFMDGANGLAMGSVAIGLIALAVIAIAHGTVAGGAIALCGAGALIGFLFWNFPSGRLFAGDSGALFAGALAALASLLVIHRTGLSPLVPAILFFPLLADALLTLAWRAYRRHSLFDGHSEHLYQIVMHGGVSHGEIALIYWAAMVACGLIGFLVARDPGVSPWIALSGLAVAAIVISAVVRRFAGRRGVSGV